MLNDNGYLFVPEKENQTVTRIYIVMTAANTRSAKAYRALTGSDYDHVAVSFNKNLSVMYSFAKTRRDIPLAGGFVSEYPSRFLAEGGDVPVKVFTIEADEEEYLRVRDVIRRMKTHPQIYTYNIYEKAASLFDGSCRISRSYTDLSFVCRLMRFGNIKSYNELGFILGPYLTYEGTLNKIAGGDEYHGAEYFDEVSPVRSFSTSALYSIKLLGRKIYESV